MFSSFSYIFSPFRSILDLVGPFLTIFNTEKPFLALQGDMFLGTNFANFPEMGVGKNPHNNI